MTKENKVTLTVTDTQTITLVHVFDKSYCVIDKCETEPFQVGDKIIEVGGWPMRNCFTHDVFERMQSLPKPYEVVVKRKQKLSSPIFNTPLFAKDGYVPL